MTIRELMDVLQTKYPLTYGTKWYTEGHSIQLYYELASWDATTIDTGIQVEFPSSSVNDGMLEHIFRSIEGKYETLLVKLELLHKYKTYEKTVPSTYWSWVDNDSRTPLGIIYQMVQQPKEYWETIDDTLDKLYSDYRQIGFKVDNVPEEAPKTTKRVRASRDGITWYSCPFSEISDNKMFVNLDGQWTWVPYWEPEN